MKFVGDFHIHSKYARATSKDMNLENLDVWAKIKGIKVISTGDFTHPAWFQELKDKLEPAEPGLYKLRRLQGSESRSPTLPVGASGLKGLPADEAGTRFILTTEISCIYTTKGGVRKVHLILFAPSLEAVEKINTQLGWIGNLKSDGRPIIGINAKDVVKICLDASPDCMVIPAHAWTPWFAVFGSKSGFNSLEECFDEYTQYIYAIETGLSSDPAMNWQLSQLDNITFILPYSPSYPGSIVTFLSLTFIIPSATSGKVASRRTVSSASSKIENSFPRACIIFSYSPRTLFEPTPTPKLSAIISSKGIKLLKGIAPSGRNPSGRSASSATRFRTPIVSGLAHLGHTLLCCFDSSGFMLMSHARCPS